MNDANDESPIDAVRKYLVARFPGASVEQVNDPQAHKSQAAFFRVDDGPGDYSLEIPFEYLEDRTAEAVTGELERHEISDLMRAHEGRIIVLVEGGALVRD